MKGLAQANRLAQKKKFDLAEAEYRKSLKIFKDHPGVHYNRALAYLSHGDSETGLDALQESLKSCPNYLPALRVKQNLLKAVHSHQ